MTKRSLKFEAERAVPSPSGLFIEAPSGPPRHDGDWPEQQQREDKMTIDFDFRERPKPASSQRRPVAVTALQPGPRRDVGDGSMLATPPEPQEHNSVWVDLDIRVVAGAAAIVIAKLFLLGLLLHSVWS